jgi:predicted porin
MARKLMMATTSLAAALAAAGAQAQTNSVSEPIKLTLGGYFSMYGAAGFQQSDAGQPGAHRHNFDIQRESEIHFKGETRLDNGLIIGVQVELEGETSADQIDESYIWFQGDWGRVMLGATNSAAYKLAVGYPSVDSAFDSQDPTFRLWSGAPVSAAGVTPGGPPNVGGPVGDPRFAGLGGNGVSSIDGWIPIISNDSEKITYLSPRFGGIRLGLSYTPDNTEMETVPGGSVAANGGSGAGFAGSNNPATWSNLVAAGLNYDNKFGPISVQAAIGAERGILEGSSLVGTTRFGDRTSWQSGVVLGYAGLQLGGGYFEDDNGIDATATGADASGKQRSFGVGASYSMGPLTLASNWLHARRSRDPVGLDEKLDRILVGARYALGPGIDLRSHVQYFDYKGAVLPANTTANNNNGWIFVFGTFITF